LTVGARRFQAACRRAAAVARPSSSNAHAPVVATIGVVASLFLAGCGKDTVIAVSAPGAPVSTGSSKPDAAPPPIDGAVPVVGPLHTQGAKIVDANGNEVRLTGVSWFGLESALYEPHGLWIRSLDSMLDQIARLGFNSLRIPFSNQLFDAGNTPNSLDPNLNPDLVGLDGFAVLDKVVAGASKRGLYVVLDRHHPDAGAMRSPLWYDDQYPESRWISDFTKLAARYANNPAVVAFDLHNDLSDPATWGDGSATTDWAAAAKRAGDAILAVNPNLLVIVEGIETAGGSSYCSGGNLRAAQGSPVTLSVANRLVYGAQDFPSTVSGECVVNQSLYQASNYPNDLPGVWDQTWGYLIEQDIAPVYLVGFGSSPDDSASDQQWFSTIASYIAEHRMSFAYWCLNPTVDSGETSGLLESDWQTADPAKMAVLTPLLAPR
jgi:endoglucanase